MRLAHKHSGFVALARLEAPARRVTRPASQRIAPAPVARPATRRRRVLDAILPGRAA